MHLTLRTLLPGLLLVALAPVSQAQEALPDPLPPAVVGRPLDRIHPAPRAGKPAAAKPSRSRPAATQQAKAAAHPPKRSLDDRVDPRVRLDDVGKGTHFARKATQPGTYFVDRDRAAVRKYYAAQPVPRTPAPWNIGEPLPPGAAVAGVPSALMARLSPVPPGHRYVQVGGDVLLVDAASKMVVDGISRAH